LIHQFADDVDILDWCPFDRGATAAGVKAAFELLLGSKDVKAIFVNICESGSLLYSISIGLTLIFADATARFFL